MPDGEVVVELGIMLEVRQLQLSTKMQNGVKPLNALPGAAGVTRLAGGKAEIPRRSRKMNGRPLNMIRGVRRRQAGLSRNLLIRNKVMLSVNQLSRAVGRHGVKRHGGYPR